MVPKPQKVCCNQTRNEVYRDDKKLSALKSPLPAMRKSQCISLYYCIVQKSKVFSAFKSSIKTFDNIFGNRFSRINTVLLKIQNFAFKPEVCKMGGSFRLQNGLNLLCRVWPSGQHLKRHMLWSQLDALYDFQNL